MAREYREGQQVIVNSEILLYEDEPATVVYTDQDNTLIQVKIHSDNSEWYLDQNELAPAPRVRRSK